MSFEQCLAHSNHFRAVRAIILEVKTDYSHLTYLYLLSLGLQCLLSFTLNKTFAHETGMIFLVVAA